VPVTFSLLAQSESHQRERAPRFAAENRDRPGAWVCPGFSVPLRCSTSPAVCATHERSSHRHTFSKLNLPAKHARVTARQCSTETPGWPALLGGSQGPQQQSTAVPVEISGTCCIQHIDGYEVFGCPPFWLTRNPAPVIILCVVPIWST